ncbi:hypothetical protein [Methanolacinia petrolearia]|uniref:hypothetical protein n=1 Tax=Methanolacinia petrolearia TaxID=54120 RepID=UPI003BABE97A
MDTRESIKIRKPIWNPKTPSTNQTPSKTQYEALMRYGTHKQKKRSEKPTAIKKKVYKEKEISRGKSKSTII